MSRSQRFSAPPGSARAATRASAFGASASNWEPPGTPANDSRATADGECPTCKGRGWAPHGVLGSNCPDCCPEVEAT